MVYEVQFREPRHDCAVRAARAPTNVLGSVQSVGGSRTTRIVTARPNTYLIRPIGVPNRKWPSAYSGGIYDPEFARRKPPQRLHGSTR